MIENHIENQALYQLLPDDHFDEDKAADNGEWAARLHTALDECVAWAQGDTRLCVTEYVDGVRLEPVMLTREELDARQSAREHPLYLAVTQRQGGQWLVYAPDVPEVTGVGATREEAERTFAVALSLHLQTLRANGKPLPEPLAAAHFVSVAA